MPNASPSIVPSARSENGRQSPVSDNAGVLLNPTNAVMSLKVSTPPVRTRSERPSRSSATAEASAAKELAQAASVVWFTPCRSNRLATRPATTLVRPPGNVDSVQGGMSSATRSAMRSVSSGDSPCSRITRRSSGPCRRVAV